MTEGTLPVVVIGAGASGTLLALQLAQRPGPPIILVERGLSRTACGVAFGTHHPAHILNVRAAGMSALPEDPGHFANWLTAHGGGASDDFASRGLYGRYLCDLLANAQAISPGRIETVVADVQAVTPGGNGYHVHLSDGRILAASGVIISLGNLPPPPPNGLTEDIATDAGYINDPWADDVAARVRGHDRVAVLGTGLSAVDAALRLDAGGFEGEIWCLSRRGLTPQSHLNGTSPALPCESISGSTLSALVGTLRQRSIQQGWRAAIDSLRPVTQQLWQDASTEQRRRFVRHLRPYWDVHRHRLAPVVADKFQKLVDSGRVRVVAGRIASVTRTTVGLAIDWLPRGAACNSRLAVGAIINCTGPQTDIRRSREPLLQQLLAAGMIRPDALALGIDVDRSCRVIDAAGNAVPGLYCIGPMTRGTFWEIVAIPDIRLQCAKLAEEMHGAPTAVVAA